MDSFVSESRRQLLFWSRIMEEHALFIRLGLPPEETSLRRQAAEFEELFKRLRHDAGAAVTRQAVRRVNEAAIGLITRLIKFKSEILHRLLTCENTVGFNLYPLLIDHIRREAIYFRTALVRLQEGIMTPPPEQLLRDEVFWLRIMADHARFIAHLLDPSERTFVEQARSFAVLFDNLRLHAEDFRTMLSPRTFETTLLPEDVQRASAGLPGLGKGLPNTFVVPSLLNFTDESLRATADLRDFKRAARDLIAGCRILSIIPELLADHVFREAVRAIEDIGALRKSSAHLIRPS